jgi:hypothetical protein
MEVIDLSEFRDEEGIISLENRIRGTVKHGLSWYGEMEAQDWVTRRLQQALGEEHLLLRNVPLVGTEVTAPMILFSPQGARLLQPSTVRGNFRAKENDWQTFDSRTRKFKSTRPNIQFRALAIAQGLLRYFESQGFPLPELEAVLVFTNPQAHVDTANAEARVVQADAIEHFASKLMEGQAIMDNEDIHMLVDALLNPKLPEPEPELEELEAEMEGDVFDAEPLRPVQTRSELTPVRRVGRFTVRQWVVLAILLVFEIAILLAIAFIVLTDQGVL